MEDYVGSVRSDTLLAAGALHLQRIKKKAYNSMHASNPHELIHCLEVLNLLDVAEVVCFAAAERKETRDKYKRIDYPYKNPVLDEKVLVCRKNTDGPAMEWRDIIG
jgi:succinate dehydrogenase/fumarate reductase flavoprotein subunit